MRTGLKVLVVDDEEDVCFLLVKMLNMKGIECYPVYSLAEAKKFLKFYHPSVIFLDNHLPDGLGIEFIGYLKEKCPDTRVVIITAHDSPENDRKMLDITNEIIYKPFDSKMILSALERNH